MPSNLGLHLQHNTVHRMESRYLGHGFWFKVIGTSLLISVHVTVWNYEEEEGVKKDIETLFSLQQNIPHMSQVLLFCCCCCFNFSPPLSFSPSFSSSFTNSSFSSFPSFFYSSFIPLIFLILFLRKLILKWIRTYFLKKTQNL